MRRAKDLDPAQGTGFVIDLVVTASGAESASARRYRLALPALMTIDELRRWLGEQPNDEALRLAKAFDTAAGFARFGDAVSGETRLEAGDRLELLQPLLADPKLARRQRVQAGRSARARQGQFDRWTRNR